MQGTEAGERPASTEEALERLQTLERASAACSQGLERRRGWLLMALLAVVALGVADTLRVAHGGAAWSLGLLAAALVGLVWALLRAQGRLTVQQRQMAFLAAARGRADGTATDSGRTGLDLRPATGEAGALFERDLDLLGPDSLFKLLATVRTGPGELGLARLLLEPATAEAAQARQDAVRELCPRLDLRARIALVGVSNFHRIPARYFDDWLAEDAPPFHPAWRWVLLVTAVLAVLNLHSGLTHLVAWGTALPRLLAVLAVQGAVSLSLRERVRPILEKGVRLRDHVRLFSEGLAVLDRERFSSRLLVALQRSAREPAGAVRQLARLESQLAIIEQRPKEYFLLFSLLLAAGTQAAIAVAAWKRANAEAMRGWLQAWAEFEALNALAAYAFEHPEDVWPTLLPASHSPLFEAEALGHPLLPGAVRNGVRLEADGTRFLLISGSNMAGKSTLMRTIGINAVLARAGAPVRAASLRLTPFALGASLALTDSLAEGKSKFRAEVERLAAVVEASRHGPVLFLVDEIFSGTNSADRLHAARAVLESLLANGAIGALSTHDLALARLAEELAGGANVHMASPDPDDPLAFDYLLKPGVNTSSNALAIVRMLGLDT